MPCLIGSSQWRQVLFFRFSHEAFARSNWIAATSWYLVRHRQAPFLSVRPTELRLLGPVALVFLIRPILLVCGRLLHLDLRLHARSTHLRWVSVPRGRTHDQFCAICGWHTQREVRHSVLVHNVGSQNGFQGALSAKSRACSKRPPMEGSLVRTACPFGCAGRQR